MKAHIGVPYSPAMPFFFQKGNKVKVMIFTHDSYGANLARMKKMFLQYRIHGKLHVPWHRICHSSLDLCLLLLQHFPCVGAICIFKMSLDNVFIIEVLKKYNVGFVSDE
jgi:hypothetical protein